jgi:hypothetical protein
VTVARPCHHHRPRGRPGDTEEVQACKSLPSPHLYLRPTSTLDLDHTDNLHHYTNRSRLQEDETNLRHFNHQDEDLARCLPTLQHALVGTGGARVQSVEE